MLKRCSVCDKMRSKDDFHRKKDNKDGRDNRCKYCMKEYYEKNRDRKLSYQKTYDKKNRRRIHEKRMKSPEYRIADSIRRRLRRALKGNWKSGEYIEKLGCTIKELKLYLEEQFIENMNWSNYGEWHIDHIVPLSSFDFSDDVQLRQACHFSNLQPLWAKDNILKSNRSGSDNRST